MAMLSFEVYKSGTLPDTFTQDIKMKFISVENGIATLAKETAAHMRGIISGNKKKPTNKKGAENQLEDSITADQLGKSEWGIGNTMTMAPYWAILNYGGMPSFKGNYHYVRGSFSGATGGWAFKYDPTSSQLWKLPSGLKLKTPLPALNYIEKTKAWLQTVWKVHANLGYQVGRRTVFTK